MGGHTGPSGPRVSRRELCIAAGAAGISALAGCSAGNTEPPVVENAETIADHSSPELEKWVDEVPRPGVAEPSGTKDGHPRYEMEMREVEQKIHRDLLATTVWGYDGSSRARRSKPSRASRSTSAGRTTSRTSISCQKTRRFTATSFRTIRRAYGP